MSHPVLHELTHHRYLRERLEAAFPDADEETLMDTLEGMTSLTDSLAELLRSSQEDQSLASALRSGRQVRPAYQRPTPDPGQGASPLRGLPALPRLRAFADAGPPSTVCPTSGHRTEGERRVDRAALCHTSPDAA